MFYTYVSANVKMRSRLEIFLTTLDDYELVNLFKYRFDGFLDNSKQKVLTELKARNIDKDDIDKIIQDNKDEYAKRLETADTYVCPRCYSTKSITEKEEYPVVDLATFMIEKHHRQCQVCNYSADREKMARRQK